MYYSLLYFQYLAQVSMFDVSEKPKKKIAEHMNK